MILNLGKRYCVSPLSFTIWVSVLNVVLYHRPLWRYISAGEPPEFSAWLALFCLLFMISQLVLLGLSIISVRLCQWFCYAMLSGNAVALYFIEQFRTLLDSNMMGNVLNTRLSEASDFVSVTLLVYFVCYALIPILAVSRVSPTPCKRSFLIVCWLGSFVIGSIGIYAGSTGWLWIDQNAKQLGGRLLPWSYLINTIRYTQSQQHKQQAPVLLPDGTILNDQPALVVLVIGETARAANFSLYDYPRQTTPMLRRQGAIALRGTDACTTYTTGSLACILGHQPTSVFAAPDEPLPSYLKRSGVEVVWRTNNWGEPPIEVTQYQRASELRSECAVNDCAGDAALLAGLGERIKRAKRDKVLMVLHQKGSHGPRYDQRYPKRFERFTPVCRTVELSNCDQQSLVNGYDNSLLYTDYLLSQIIDQLKLWPDRPVLMMYISDHGESLGENGFYLHGAPYAIAPDEQTRIPFVLWMNQKFINHHQINVKTLRQRQSHSQYHVFHSLLSALDIKSPIYNAQLDLFRHP